jgi:hypothetical protein
MANAPKPPSAARQPFSYYNNLTRWWADTCDAPFTVWAETLWPALWQTLVQWYDIDLKQIIISYFRPSEAFQTPGVWRKGRHGHRNSRGRPRGALRKIAEFDVNSFIARHLPAAKEVKARRITTGSGILWVFEAIYEVINLCLMIIELAGDFIYRWSTSIYMSEYCQAQADNILVAHGETQGTIPPAGWVGTVMPTIDKIRGDVIWVVSTLNPGSLEGVMVFSAIVTPQVFEDAPIGGIRIREIGEHGSVTVAEKVQQVQWGEFLELSIQANTKPGFLYGCEDFSTGGFLLIGNPSVFFQAANR